MTPGRPTRPAGPPLSGPALALLVGLALAPVPAHAHGVELDLAPGPEGVSAEARYANGRPLAGSLFEIRAPGDDAGPHRTGRTDDAGRFTFTPDAPGDWRVRVVDATGHGLERTVHVPEGGGAAVVDAPAHGHLHLPGVLRPLLGVALVALVFGGLWLHHRRRGPPPL